MRSSIRPWADQRPGRLWHAEWRTTDGFIDLRRFWEDGRLDEYRQLVIFVCQNYPTELSKSFSAADDEGVIADAIGAAFDAVLGSRIGHLDDRIWEAWDRGLHERDFRLQVKSAVSLAYEDAPFTVFGA